MVFYKLIVEEKMGGAFSLGVLLPIALEITKAVVWDLKEKLKGKYRGVVG